MSYNVTIGDNLLNPTRSNQNGSDWILNNGLYLFLHLLLHPLPSFLSQTQPSLLVPFLYSVLLQIKRNVSFKFRIMKIKELINLGLDLVLGCRLVFWRKGFKFRIEIENTWWMLGLGLELKSYGKLIDVEHTIGFRYALILLRTWV